MTKIDRVDLATMTASRLTCSGPVLTDMALDAQDVGAVMIVYDPDNDRYLMCFGCNNDSFGQPPLTPGKIHSVNPDTGASQLIWSGNAPASAWYTRVIHYPFLGGIILHGWYEEPLRFIVTRP